jgi:hypothetical protein
MFLSTSSLIFLKVIANELHEVDDNISQHLDHSCNIFFHFHLISDSDSSTDVDTRGHKQFD